MVQKSQATTFWMHRSIVDNGKNYQPQLVSLPDFWLPSTVTSFLGDIFWTGMFWSKFLDAEKENTSAGHIFNLINFKIYRNLYVKL